MKTGSPSLLLALSLALLTGCSASSTGSAQLAVSVPQALSASISRISVTASAADFPAVSVELVSSNGVWGGTLDNLPVGPHRAFLAQAFDASGTRLFEGSASGVSILADQASLVAITLQQVNAPPPFQNEAPLIDSLTASSTSVTVGGSLSLAAIAHDPNAGDTLSYAWSSTAGSFSSTSAASTSWTAPASLGLQTLTLHVTDPGGLSSSLALTVNVVPSGEQGQVQLSISFNTFPRVAALSATAAQLTVGQSTSVSASALDVDGDNLSYAWSTSCSGTWSNASSSTAQFTPDALPAGTCNNCELTVSVSDGRGGQTTGSVALCVSTTPAPQHLPPVILSASGSSGLASPGQVLTYEVVASDPEGSALSFSWAFNTGSPGAPDHTASSSRITWTAPSCVSASTPPSITATVTNAFNLTATQHFSVTGLPVCVPPSWASTTSMASPRSGHTATLLPNGKVLVAGGQNVGGTAEEYDPASGTWSATGPMRVPRSGHAATLLPNGKVLVMGGADGSSRDTSELYDPASRTWSPAGLLFWGNAIPTATLLLNGKVLVAGGIGPMGPFAEAEVFDPALGRGTWSATGSMHAIHFYHTATRLPDGKVLVAGGVDGNTPTTAAEVYDPASGTWSTTGSMFSPHVWHTATLMNNGRVLVVGTAYAPPPSLSAELYDPATGTWSGAASMARPRGDGHMATLLPNGKVLVVGGSSDETAEEYDPALDTWSPAGAMASPRYRPTATLLPNGKVLIAGGYNNNSPLATAELFTPGTP